MSSLMAILVTFSIIILVHEWGHFIAARRIGVVVERFSLGFGPKLFGVTIGRTEYCLCLFPIGGYVKMEGEAAEEPGPRRLTQYRARSVGERMRIVAAGPVMNYLFAFLVFTAIFVIGAPVVSFSASTQIGRVMEGYPAESAGVKAADTILSINGKTVSTWEEVTRAIHSQTQKVELVLERDGELLTRIIEPRLEEVTNDQGQRVKMGMVGIAPSQTVETVRYPIHRAAARALHQIWTVTFTTLRAMGWIVTGRLSVKETLTGPIGIFFITSSVAAEGPIYLMQLIAVLSTALGFFNLLPIPVLDGGHLAFLAVEKLRGRPLSVKTQEVMSWVGLGLIAMLLVMVSYNDLLKYKVTDRFLNLFGAGGPSP